MVRRFEGSKERLQVDNNYQNYRDMGRLFLVSIICLILSASSLYSQKEGTAPATYKVKVETDVRVPMRDGIMLSANIFRPDAPGSYPVMLMRSPYGNGTGKNNTASDWVSHGYAVVLQDTRGRYESEGLFDAMQPEADDGSDTQQWIVSQKWCNGKIGTFGGSYVGYTQWMPAPKGNPYLASMFPVVTFSDLHNVAYQNGAFFLMLFGPWSFEMTQPYNVSTDTVAKNTDKILMSLPLIDMDKKLGWRISFLNDWLLHPEHDRYWYRTSIGAGHKEIRAAVFAIGGWYDILLKGTIENFTKMNDPDIPYDVRQKQKLMIGPWVHDEGKRSVGELDFGRDAEIDEDSIMLRWFDETLKGSDNGMLKAPPVRIFVMGKNEWRYENEWPLARTKYTDYYFHGKGKANSVDGDGTLDIRQPGSENSDNFLYDPADPVRTIGGMGPYDQKDVEKRNDVLVYSTPALKEDLEVTGPVSAFVYASSSAKNTDFTAKLVDVYPDGRAMRICEGIIRADHRDPVAAPSNIEPGKVYEYKIDLWATSNIFLKGHKIRVEISSSNFPRFDRNLNTGNFFATDTVINKAAQVVFHDTEHPSHVVLPVIRNK
jgi:uncharacterized protein